MKRSDTLRLVLMASTVVAITGCGDDEKTTTTTGEAFRNLQLCIDSGKYTEAECTTSYAAAKKQHIKAAPRYNDRALCEQQHGFNCGNVKDTDQLGYARNIWQPVFAGFFVSSLLRNNSYCATEYWRCSSPLYHSSSGGYYSPNGYRLSRNSSGKYAVSNRALSSKKPKAAKIHTRTTVAARGGFGTRARSSSSSSSYRSTRSRGG